MPSITKPKFEVASELTLLPINGLSDVRSPWEKYVVLGAGKTGIDAVLFLISQNVNPDKILWIMPNDAWFTVRDVLHIDVFEATMFGLFNTLIRYNSSKASYTFAGPWVTSVSQPLGK